WYTKERSGVNSIYDMDGKPIRMGANPLDVSVKIRNEMFDVAGVKPRPIYTSAQNDEWMMEAEPDATTTSGIVFQLTPDPTMLTVANQEQIRMVDFTVEVIEEVRRRHPDWYFMEAVPVCAEP